MVNVSKSQYYEFRHNIRNLGNQNSKYSWRIRDLENPQTGTQFANSVLMYKIFRYRLWFDVFVLFCCSSGGLTGLYTYRGDQACRKRCGMAVVAAPKICREREREGRKGKKERKERRGEGKERGEMKKGEGSKRERCVVGVKHPLRLTVKNCTRQKKRGEDRGKMVKDVRRDRNGQRKYSDGRRIEM